MWYITVVSDFLKWYLPLLILYLLTETGKLEQRQRGDGTTSYAAFSMHDPARMEKKRKQSGTWLKEQNSPPVRSELDALLSCFP